MTDKENKDRRDGGEDRILLSSLERAEGEEDVIPVNRETH